MSPGRIRPSRAGCLPNSYAIYCTKRTSVECMCTSDIRMKRGYCKGVCNTYSAHEHHVAFQVLEIDLWIRRAANVTEWRLLQ